MKLYDNTANEYDVRQNNPSTRHLRKWEEYVIKRFAKGKVLDIGCGTGYHMSFLKSLGMDAIGVDISTEMLLSNNHRNLIRADANRLPFMEKSFDTVICMFSTLNMLDEKAIEEMSFVLKEKGNLIISVSSIWDKKCPEFLAKFNTMNSEEHMKRKTVHISKNILNMKLFTKNGLVQLFNKYGFTLSKFYGIFIYQRPYWGRFEQFPLSGRIKLWLDWMQLYSDLGAMYIYIFSKNNPKQATEIYLNNL